METDKERAASTQIRSELGLPDLDARLTAAKAFRDADELAAIADDYAHIVDEMVAGLVQIEMELQGLADDEEPELAGYRSGFYTAKKIMRGQV